MRYTGSGGDETGHGVAIRRARLDVRGFVYSPDVRYRMQLAFAPADLGLTEDGSARRGPVLDGYIDVRLDRALVLRAGQGKVPFNLERQASSQESRLVDRSLVDDEFTLDRDVGVTLFSDAVTPSGLVGYAAGIYAGEGHSPLGLEAPQLLYLARLELRPLGAMDHRVFTDFARRARPALGLGGAVGYLQGARFLRGNRAGALADGATEDHLYWAADALFLWRGLSAQVEAVGRRVLGDARGRGGFGVFGELGYLFEALPVAVALHYAVQVPGGAGTTLPQRREVAAGLQYFLASDPAAGLAPTHVALRFGLDDLRRWTPGEAHDHQVRAQLELLL